MENLSDLTEKLRIAVSDPVIRDLKCPAFDELNKVGRFAIGPLSDVLADKSETKRMRLCAASILANTKDPQVIEALIQYLMDIDNPGRATVAFNLKKLPDPRVIETLFQALNDEVPSVRSAAMWALVGIGDTSAIDRIILNFDNYQDEYTHWGTITALRELSQRLGDKRAIEPIRRFLSDESEKLRLAAERTVEQLELL